MKTRKGTIVICAAAIAACLVMVVAPAMGRQGHSTTKSRISAQARSRNERILGDYETAIHTWKSQHDLVRARGLLEDLVRKREMEPAVFDLAPLCAEQKDNKAALEYYRDAFVRPHRWHSSEETNPVTLGAYMDLARTAGAQADVQWVEHAILRRYRPLGGAPDLAPTSSDSATIHAYACAARALMTRGEHENGIAMAEEAAKTKPNDAAIQWIAGMVLFDANKAPEAKLHLLAAKRIGGLGGRQTRLLDLRLVHLHGVTPAETAKAEAKSGGKDANQR
jgi:tetratricopeptide (TPR) repeat protein